MGEFSPGDLAIAHHTWRLVMAPTEAEQSPTERMGAICQAVAAEVAQIRAAGNLPVVITGDCTATIGVAAGLQQATPDFTLVWFDAHGDFNTWETTPSGFVGGMPLAMLCGRGEQTILAGAGARAQPEERVILTDARDLDPQEKEAVAGSKVTRLPDVAALLTLDLPPRPIYLHFDPDVLQLADLAAVNYPAQGGPSLQTVEAALQRLADTGQVVAVSFTLWNPDLDDETGSAERVVLGLMDRLVERLA